MAEYFSQYAIPILGGALFFCGAWLFAHWVSRALNLLIRRRSSLDTSIIDLVTRVLMVSILVLAGIATLDEFGVQVSSLVAALGIFGFAIAIGLRSTTTNLFTGVMIFILKPYRVGEYIDGERVEGAVESISLFHTVVVTDEGQYVAVPNGPMWARSIRNMSRPRPRKVDIDLTVTRGPEFAQIAAAVRKIIADESAISTEFPPAVYIQTVTEKAMTIRINFWCDVEKTYDLRAEMVNRIRAAVVERGVDVTKIGPPRRRKTPAAKKPDLPPVTVADEL